MTEPLNLAAAVQAFVDAEFDAECAFLAELVRVPSDNPPGDCAAHAQRTQALLENLGYAVEAYPVPTDAVQAAGMISATNLIVRRTFGPPSPLAGQGPGVRGLPSRGPTIALNAHGDVVQPGSGWTHDPYGAEIVDEPPHGPTMYGRGVAVSKSDFATYTWALRALEALEAQGHELHGTIELHFTYDEEVGGDIGPRRLIEQGLTRPDLALGAGFAYDVTTAHNGCLHLEVVLVGRQGHAAMPDSGIDALEAATGVLQALYAFRGTLAQRCSQVHGIDHATLNVGLISGGINTNVVPDRVSLRLDRRMIPEEQPEAVEAELRALIETAAAACLGIRVEIRRTLLAMPLVPLDGAQPLTADLRRWGEHFLGTPVGEHGVPLYTDARHYAGAGIPTVLYGAGPRTLGEARGHAADECLRLSDLKAATCAVACALAERMR